LHRGSCIHLIATI